MNGQEPVLDGMKVMMISRRMKRGEAVDDDDEDEDEDEDNDVSHDSSTDAEARAQRVEAPQRLGHVVGGRL